MKVWIRNGAAALFILAMAGVAQLTGEMEVIFPEVLALVLGMWVAEKRPWKVGNLEFVLLITCAAVVGVLLVRYAPVPLLMKAGVAFLFAALLLSFAKSTFFPILSACVLPILLGTQSWVYPLAVLLMAVLIVLVRLGMEKLRLLTAEAPVERETLDVKKWGFLLLLFLLLAALPVQFRLLYLIAPPLLVTFVEFAEVESPKRKAPLRVWCVIVLCAVWGTGSRLLLMETAGLPLAPCAAVAAILALATFACLRMAFPPAGAVALLPFLLPADSLWLYPLQIAAGAAVFIGVALLTFRARRQERESPVLDELKEEGTEYRQNQLKED